MAADGDIDPMTRIRVDGREKTSSARRIKGLFTPEQVAQAEQAQEQLQAERVRRSQELAFKQQLGPG